MKIIIPMRLPSLNEYINSCRRNRYEAANFKKKVENDCLIFIKQSLKLCELKRIGLTFIWYEPNKRRDKDNICSAKKFILDALQKGKYLTNDGWAQIAYFKDEFYIDKENPRVEIIIENL